MGLLREYNASNCRINTNLELLSTCNVMLDSIRSDAMIWNWVKTTHYSVLPNKLFQNACWLQFVEMLTSWPGTEAGDFPDVYPVDVAHPSSWVAQWGFRSHDKRCSAWLWSPANHCDDGADQETLTQQWVSFHRLRNHRVQSLKNRCLEASGQFLS